MQPSEPKTISAQQASSPERIIREYLVKWGEVYGREITPALVKIWEGLVAGVETTRLREACERATTDCRFFPVPADVIPAKKADETAAKIAGEQAWQKLLKYIERYFLGGDIGLKPGAPTLPPDIDHAQRAAGGLQWIEGCPAEDLQWAKKRFIEAYEAFSQSPDLKSFASTDDARRILSQAATELAERKKLTA